MAVDALRVLLVDDHRLFRKGLVALLSPYDDVEVVGEAESGPEAVEKARAIAPDLILMDIHMPEGDGLEAVRVIKKEMPGIKVVMLTVSAQDDDLFTAIKSGADGYLLKNLDPSHLHFLLEGLRRGEAPVSGLVADRVLRELRKDDGAPRQASGVGALTAKELEVLGLIVKGDTNKEIARALQVTENTVKLHLRNIMGKLHLRNRTEVAIYATNQGLVGSQPCPSPD